MLYLLFIVFSSAIVAVLNIFIGNMGVLYAVLSVIIAVIAVVAIDGIFAFIVRWVMPKKWFTVDKSYFSVGKKKARFLEKIGIKKWKDLIPELGGFTSFHKNKISDPTNNEFVSRYIIEANYGIMCHFTGMVFGFIIMAFYPPYAFNIALPVAVINLFMNYLSFAILRYNLPKLRVLYKYNEKRNNNK